MDNSSDKKDVTNWSDIETEKENISLKDKLLQSFYDECDGVKEYNGLSKEMEVMYPNKPYGHILKDMAKEEGIHMRHLHDILSDMGIVLDGDACKKYQDTQEILNSI